jgi:hypothetical protein
LERRRRAIAGRGAPWPHLRAHLCLHHHLADLAVPTPPPISKVRGQNGWLSFGCRSPEPAPPRTAPSIPSSSPFLGAFTPSWLGEGVHVTPAPRLGWNRHNADKPHCRVRHNRCRAHSAPPLALLLVLHVWLDPGGACRCPSRRQRLAAGEDPTGGASPSASVPLASGTAGPSCNGWWWT